jgi:TetR/AcrR family transcriptional regulator, transcriptional repressor of aconitase
MPKISEEHRQARRDQILAAVWRCFLRKGFQGTSLDDIIRESGLSAGAVYTHFTGKEELILSAISAYMSQLGGFFGQVLSRAEAMAPMDFIHQMASALEKHTNRIGVDLNRVIMMGWGEAQTNPAVKSVVSGYQAKYRAALADVMRHWQRNGYLPSDADPVDVAKALFSFLLGFVAQQALLGDAPPEALTRGMKVLLAAHLPPEDNPKRKMK